MKIADKIFYFLIGAVMGLLMANCNQYFDQPIKVRPFVVTDKTIYSGYCTYEITDSLGNVELIDDTRDYKIGDIIN